MIRLYKYFIVILALCAVVSPAKAWDSAVKGDPELLWNTPLGNPKLEINAENRCRLIRTVLPNYGATEEFRRNRHTLLSEYISNLYAQAVKISAYIEAEKNAPAASADLSDALKLQEEAAKRSGDIARRLNIINSFESGITVLEALMVLQALPPKQVAGYEDECPDTQSGE